ncbi:MAG: NAD(P)/FAD-dependent oxidoreductase [Deltaproteobacteria bacterium]|nr:NAD(P)/FAD-dependent oxidoreductase [Deltaproteobacteria bacterium]
MAPKDRTTSAHDTIDSGVRDARRAEVDVEVLVVGAGFSGLAMGHALRRVGVTSFRILEKAQDVGGTWRENTYPGAACDVPSHLYSFSFAPDPGWSRSYSPQPEILAYLRETARQQDLLAHVVFGAEVIEARFDEARGAWSVVSRDTQTGASTTTTSRSLVLGNGALHIPSIPRFEGAETFAGPQFHSARWDHAVDLRGKRVAVIGTGASAIQFVPAIQPDVAHLSVFQRTAPWVVPKRDFAFSPTTKAILKSVPALQRAYRAFIYGVNEAQAYGFVYEPRLMKLLGKLAIQHMHREIAHPVLRKKLTPTFVMGCKRVLLSNDWYRALRQPNVDVVTHAIDRIETNGVRTRDGVLHEVDAILYGTGFSVAEYLSSMRIHGRGGVELNERWQKRPEVHLGISVSGFPNLFLLMGPATGLGHNSMIFMIEAQARYAAQCVRRIEDHGLRMLDVKPEAQAAFTREVQERMKRTVWASGCASWYQAGDGESVTALWPGFTFEYWARTRKPDFSQFVAT